MFYICQQYTPNIIFRLICVPSQNIVVAVLNRTIMRSPKVSFIKLIISLAVCYVAPCFARIANVLPFVQLCKKYDLIKNQKKNPIYKNIINVIVVS